MSRLILVCLLSLVILSPSAYAKKVKAKVLIQSIQIDFDNGKYEDVLNTLSIMQRRVKKNSRSYKKFMGLIYYWRGVANARVNEFPKAIENFEKSIKLKYKSTDLHYEYAQALYVSDEYLKARRAFRYSVKQNYKTGVSLYYMAYISQELKEYKKAVSYYNQIEKLPKKDKADVMQPARMQIADIYLSQVKKQPDNFKAIEQYVIPQYQKALAWNDTSAMAKDIRQKIEELQRRYDLLLFKMKNGRPTVRPAYYLKVGTLGGYNSNVLSKTDSQISSLSTADYATPYYTLSSFGKYTIYPNSSYSISPQISASTTDYVSSTDTINVLDTYTISPSVQFSFEHTFERRLAAFYMNLDYSYIADDASGDGTKEEASTSYGIQFSEELEFWAGNTSIFRYKYTTLTHALYDTSSYTSHGFSYEQMYRFGQGSLLYFYNHLELKDVASNQDLNSRVLIMRVDSIFSTFYGLFNPTLYVSTTMTNFYNDAGAGTQTLNTIGFNLNKPLFGGKWYLTADYSYNTQTAPTDSDIYDQSVATISLDYFF